MGLELSGRGLPGVVLARYSLIALFWRNLQRIGQHNLFGRRSPAADLHSPRVCQVNNLRQALVQ